MIRASVIALALLAAACTPPAAEDKSGDPAVAPGSVATAATTREEATAQDTCGAAQYRPMIGTAIAAATFPATPNIRVITPDAMVTQDFSAQRLNVIVGTDGKIASLECF